MAEIKIEEGAEVRVGNKTGRISRRIDLTNVMVEFENGEKKIVPIQKLSSTQSTFVDPKTSDTLSIKHQEIASRRHALISRLNIYRRIPRSEMDEISRDLGLHRTTIQRMRRKFIETKSLTAFAPPNRPGGRGKSRLDPKIETIVQTLIDSRWLTRQSISAVNLYKLIVLACQEKGYRAPEIKTISRRLKSIPLALQVRKRRGSNEARDRFKRQLGSIPDANHVLAIVEIDHTKSDLIVVSEKDRLPIGRVTVTAAIDVLTGMCVALCVSPKAPSADLVGACLFRCFVPKKEWLESLGLDFEWSIWGFPDVVHSDNGSDLRSLSIFTTLTELDIRQEFRPLGTPGYGGHIENLMKRVNEVLDTVPGTTKSSITKRGDYNSVKHAAISISGLEKLLINMICNEYHKTPLNGGLSPEEHLQIAIKNEKFIPGKFQVIPASREARDTLRIRCMPMILVTVQRYGIQINKLRYSDTILNKWIGEHNPKREDKKFVVRRDPSDWSTIYFLDPRTERYFPIGFQNFSNPRFGALEYQRAIEELKRDNREITEAAIVERVRKHNQIVDEEVKKTKKAKRERRRDEAIKNRPTDLSVASKKRAQNNQPSSPATPDDQIKDTFEIEDL